MSRPDDVVLATRPSASAYMLVDSLDRYGKTYPIAVNFTTSSDWRLNFQTPILNGYFTRLALTQVNFQWNIPTILFNYNDQLGISLVGTPDSGAVITLNPGFYTPTTLAAEIQARCVAAFPASSITCVYDTKFACFTLATAVAGAEISVANAALTQMRQIRCLQTTGFANLATVSTTANSISGNIPTMLPTRWVDICSSYLTKFQRVKDGTTLIVNPRQDMLCRLFAVAPNTRYNITATDSPGSAPFSIVQDMNNPKFIKWDTSEALNNFDIQVRDEYGDILPTQAGFCSEYQITFMASET